jgi:5-methylcytosine-specific restriction endonuclease McrA
MSDQQQWLLGSARKRRIHAQELAQRSESFWQPRAYLLAPPEACEVAAHCLSEAADALVAHDLQSAGDWLRRAEQKELVTHALRTMGGEYPDVLRWRPIDENKLVAAADIDKPNPGEPLRLQVHRRDGWRCRYCGCRVVDKKARDRMREYLPAHLRWTTCYGDHAAFFVLTAVADHVVPRSWGGRTDFENLVTTCQVCNYGRGSYLLEELGLVDPRDREPDSSGKWDGLERVKRLPKRDLAPQEKALATINYDIWWNLRQPATEMAEVAD